MASQSAPSDAEDFIPHVARFGYAAKGVTYVLMAIIAAGAAVGNGEAAGTRQAMSSLDFGLIGSVLLGAIALGLGSYAAWRFYIAFADPEHDRWTKRLGALFIGAVNLGLAWQAGVLALTDYGHSNGNEAIQWTSTVMQYPMGLWAIGFAGLCIAGYGLRQMYRGFVSKLDKMLRLYKIDHAPRRSVIMIARIGITARGFVFVLIGWFLVTAARQSDPSQARAFGDSLSELRNQPYGRWLLMATAVGLFAYAIYEFVRARYRHIPTAD